MLLYIYKVENRWKTVSMSRPIWKSVEVMASVLSAHPMLVESTDYNSDMCCLKSWQKIKDPWYQPKFWSLTPEWWALTPRVIAP